MEYAYWEEEKRKRYRDLDSAIIRENQKHETRVGPARDAYMTTLTKSAQILNHALEPFIRAYEEWHLQEPSQEEQPDATPTE